MRQALMFAALVMAGTLAARDAAWQPLAWLEGEWVGEGAGEPGQAAGGSTFRFDLQDRVLVRTNRAEYPASKERPAFSHQDLMVIYREPADGPFRAIYFDNEGHVIHYRVGTAGGGALEFLSEPGAGPRYRMTYSRTAPDGLAIRFGIAPAGEAEAFRTYVEATLHKKR
jgi:hypothetical protein